MNDLISRQAAIDSLERKKDKNANGDIAGFYNKIIQNDIDMLMQLPSAQPAQPWYHEPVKCHKVPEEFIDGAGVLKVIHLTKNKDDSFFTFTVKCDYGPYAYFALFRNYDVNMNECFATLEANIGLYRYAHIFRTPEFDDLSPDSRDLKYVIAVAYRELLKALGHPLYHAMTCWKVEWDGAELRAYRSLCRKEE